MNLKEIPAISTIRDVRLNKALSLNISCRKELNATSFLALLKTATPVDSHDPSIKTWGYAPWYSGTFSAADGVYHFHLYLGGRGILTTPTGVQGMFSFDPKSSERISTAECLADGEELRLLTPNGWWLHIRLDGSATIGYGSTVGDSADAPPESIDFLRAKEALWDISDENGSGVNDVVVWLMSKGVQTTNVRYMHVASDIVKLYAQVRSAIPPGPSREHLDTLWDRHPPFPRN